MARPADFKRIVLGLHQSAADRATLGLAAELAALMRLDLHGLFVADETLLGVAGLPFAREFRALAREWRPLDVARMAEELDLAARSAERLLAEAARRLAVASSFEIVKGSATGAITGVPAAGDIVIIREPRTTGELIAPPFDELMRAAFRSAASVLVVPSRIARHTGPIVACAAEPDDPAIRIAASIAAAARESVVLIAADGDIAGHPEVVAAAAEAGIALAPLATRRETLSDARAVSHLLAHVRERLIVMTRGAVGHRHDDLPPLLAAVRQVPVLVVEPPAESGS